MNDEILKDGELFLYGTVGEIFFDEDSFSSRAVVNALSAHGRGEDITVRINSGGGFTDEGVAVYNALFAHQGKVTVVIDGVAASAASVIAMAGDEIIMRNGSYMMVHDPAGITVGNAQDHTKTIEALETIANSMAGIYADRTGRDLEEVRAEMKEERWMTPSEAVEAGYADRTEKTRARQATAFDYRMYAHAPDRMVALAESKGWELPAPHDAGAPAFHSSQKKGKPMAQKNEGAQNPGAEPTEPQAAQEPNTAAPTAASEATPTASAAPTSGEHTAKAAETPDATAAERQRAADIVAACNLRGKADMAGKYIAEGKSLSEVLAALNEMPAGQEVTAHTTGAPQATADVWSRSVEKINARVR